MNKYLAIALLAVPLMANAGHSQHGNGNGHGHGGGQNNSGGNGGHNGSGPPPFVPPVVPPVTPPVTPPGPPVQPPVEPPVEPPVVVPETPVNPVESQNGASRAIPSSISDPQRQISEVYYEQSITCVYSPNGFATSVEECYNYLDSQIQGVLDNVK